MKPLRIGICGLGTVGGGTFNVLKQNSDVISRRAGRDFIIQSVATRKPNPACDLTGIKTTDDIFTIADDPNIDVVVELIGGKDAAYQLVMRAIANGKHIVTANKALIATYGNEIFSAAREAGVIVAFEASVAGGIPIIKAIREGLGANHINWLVGIINGTANYILTKMQNEGLNFDEVLREAQKLGYAEADPSFDIEGIDAAHKLTILSALSFGVPLQFDRVHIEGITHITLADIEEAKAMGYKIKHLGIAKKTEKGLQLRVHPALIPEDKLLASVDGVLNAVMVNGDAVGSTLYYGAGAGAMPTASAVVADLIDVAREMEVQVQARVPFLAFNDPYQNLEILKIEEVETAYYLRLQVEDKAGVLAQLAGIFSEEGISIKRLHQKPIALKESSEKKLVNIILLTHTTSEAGMQKALTKIESLNFINTKPVKIRVEKLD